MLVYEGVIRWKCGCFSAAGPLEGHSAWILSCVFAWVRLEPGSHTECYSHLLDRQGTETHPHRVPVLWVCVWTCVCVCVSVCVCLCVCVCVCVSVCFKLRIKEKQKKKKNFYWLIYVTEAIATVYQIFSREVQKCLPKWSMRGWPELCNRKSRGDLYCVLKTAFSK